MKEDILFGRISVLNKIISEEQLIEAEQRQKKKAPPFTLGYILWKTKRINKSQWKAILQVMKRKLPRPVKSIEERKEDMAFAYLSVQSDYLSVEEVVKGLQYQAQISKKGLLFRLPEILVNEKYLYIYEVEDILSFQEQKILDCPLCNTRYNTVGLNAGSSIKCSRCQTAISIPEGICQKDEAQGVVKFRKRVEHLAQKYQKERKLFLSDNPDDFLKMVAGRLSSEDEDVETQAQNVLMEDFNFAWGLANSGGEENFDLNEELFEGEGEEGEGGEESNFIVLGENPLTAEFGLHRSGKGILEEEEASIISVREKVASKDIREDELFLDEIIAIGGTQYHEEDDDLSEFEDDNDNNNDDDDEEYLELGEDSKNLPHTDKVYKKHVAKEVDRTQSASSQEDFIAEDLEEKEMIAIGSAPRQKKDIRSKEENE